MEKGIHARPVRVRGRAALASDGCIAPSAPAAAHYDHPHEKKRTAGAFRRHLPQRSSPAAALVAMLRAACALMLAAEKCTHTHTHKKWRAGPPNPSLPSLNPARTRAPEHLHGHTRTHAACGAFVPTTNRNSDVRFPATKSLLQMLISVSIA